MKLLKFVITILVLLSFFIPLQPVRADVAPPPVPGLGGLRPFGYQSTEVQMMYERVEISLEPTPELNDDYSVTELVHVTAWFVLHNTGTKDENMKVSFPLDSIINECNNSNDAPRSWGIEQLFTVPGSFKVESDGRLLETQNLEVPGMECVNWATFDVQFPVNKDVLLKVDYSMTTWGSGHNLMLEYILETGVGWKGLIKQAYIVFRLPYLATTGNIDASQTTSGYQSLYNEIFWSYRDIEPTPQDNIFIAFFEPAEWMKLQSMENQVEQNPFDTNTWVNMFDEYASGAPYYSDQTKTALYEKAIKFNPDNAELYARYAEFITPNCCYSKNKRDLSLRAGGREYINSRIIPLLNHAFSLDPNNQVAGDVLSTLAWAVPDLAYTYPPTIPPTSISPFTATPSITPSPTITFAPTETPVVVTVVQTKLVYHPTSTPMPKPTETIAVTPTANESIPQKGTNSSSTLFGALVVFIVGAGSGWLISKRQKK